MSDSTPLYNQLFSLLSHPRQSLQVGEPAQRAASQYSKYRDLRHLVNNVTNSSGVGNFRYEVQNVSVAARMRLVVLRRSEALASAL